MRVRIIRETREQKLHLAWQDPWHTDLSLLYTMCSRGYGLIAENEALMSNECDECHKRFNERFDIQPSGRWY